jgi:Flp pilus assembly protein protease CpaA
MEHDLGPRLAVAAAMLLVASLSDLRTRRVPNLHWLPYSAMAAAFALPDLAGGRAWPTYAVAAGACALAWLLFRLRLFGGADAKALMVLAFLVPWAPAGLPVPPVLGSLALASMAVAAVPLALLAWNLLHGRAAFPAILLGLPIPLERAEAAHVWPIQEPGPDGRLRWRYAGRLQMDLRQAYDGLRAAGAREVWVTPKVPFVLAILVGLVGWTLLAPALARLLAP